MRVFVFIVVLSLILVIPTAAQVQTWNIDPAHYRGTVLRTPPGNFDGSGFVHQSERLGSIRSFRPGQDDD